MTPARTRALALSVLTWLGGISVLLLLQERELLGQWLLAPILANLFLVMITLLGVVAFVGALLLRTLLRAVWTGRWDDDHKLRDLFHIL